MRTVRLGHAQRVFLHTKGMWISALQYSLNELEVKAVSEDMKIAWDSLEISTEDVQIEEPTFYGTGYPIYSYTLLSLTATAVDPNWGEDE